MSENYNELETKEKDVEFEEVENAEEMGNAQDYLTGVGIGVGIVVSVVALT
jgi:hypothetical protein